MSLLLTPTGRDASVAAALLKRSGIHPGICSSLEDLYSRLSDDIHLVILADEALRAADLRPISA